MKLCLWLIDVISSSSISTGKPMPIQWHISDDLASGSVMVMTRLFCGVMLDKEDESVGEYNSTIGV